jgi:hypothetical protein
MDDPGDMEPGQSTRDLTSDCDRLWGWEQSSSQHLAQGLSLDQPDTKAMMPSSKTRS